MLLDRDFIQSAKYAQLPRWFRLLVQPIWPVMIASAAVVVAIMQWQHGRFISLFAAIIVSLSFYVVAALEMRILPRVKLNFLSDEAV